MTLDVLADGAEVALRRDPLWRGSGAETLDEYAIWAANICGMACLKMILASRGEIVPTIELARRCTDYGGYVVNEGSIKGLIYAPFVSFVKEAFGLRAEVMTNVATVDIPAILSRSRFFIASVSSSIRWPEREPPSKGGHLVLITRASDEGFRFHNPSGHNSATRANAVLAAADFDRFFANRGIAVAI
ncbi:C39 family peptidase [Mesorhizobium sp.]|uniref:C39 family peptidase n=1 Tax=Mesorhizobium sp. TaxID=1871066 RepID=UPI0025E2218B|nr:C39 family peptidase [Mesorhizobium sp.]